MTRYRSSPTCSKCYTTGHTKRGCPTYRAKAEKWLAENPEAEGYNKPYWVQEVEGYKNIEKNKEWRTVVLENLKDIGLGVGALVSSKDRYDNTENLYLVTDMRWDGINLRASGNECVDYYEHSKQNYKEGSAYPEMTVSSINNCRSSALYYPQFKDKDDNELFYSASDRLEIVSPSEPSPPDDWVNDEAWAKGLF